MSNNTAHQLNLFPAVSKRNGNEVPFDAVRIHTAIYKSFLDPRARIGDLGVDIHKAVDTISSEVVSRIRTEHHSRTIQIEKIQDMVESALMAHGFQKVARYYVLYREAQAEKRAQNFELESDSRERVIHINDGNDVTSIVTESQLLKKINNRCDGLTCNADALCAQVLNEVFDGIKRNDFNAAIVMAASSRMEYDPDYGYAAARFLRDNLWSEATGYLSLDVTASYADVFPVLIERGISNGIFDKRLDEFDIPRLSVTLDGSRDLQFSYLGLQTLYDRYFTHDNDVRYELPQAFYMRVAMGLALNEENRTERAIEFYELLSGFYFNSSTPTLFNSGTFRSQMSSCYLTTVPDDLAGIMDSYKSNALLSKYAGGLGNDWTPVRAMGSLIKGTNGKSQGVIPFLGVNNALAVSVNQGGRRRGAVCSYLETWHLDIEDFLELRKNTGDERRRTHDMHTANWIPDLFMKRVQEEGEWTLFSPSDCTDLHDLSGTAFEQRYQEYEAMVIRGEMKLYKTVRAVELWRKMLTMLLETGHPWFTFKDPCNVRYTNQHVGVVHSSNLCTEITLHTNKDEIAVCNLGSINMARHMVDGVLDQDRLKRSVTTAMRMLDNVIDLNFYNDDKAKHSNFQHRPVGLGLMGFQDCLYEMGVSYVSREAVDFADQSMEAISYYAIEASVELAVERGSYSTFDGSLWSQGILPIDSLAQLVKARGEQYIQVDSSTTLDWDTLREKAKQGMRNSNCLAIAPTATISNICGVSQSIEPTYMNMYVKSNLSGEFMVVNPYLVKELKSYDIWDAVMINELKRHEGSVQEIERIPSEVKALFRTAFEVDQNYLVASASRRQKWIDQAQSLNLYVVNPSGRQLNDLYMLTWTAGLKTTYYLRSTGATGMETSADSEGSAAVCSILDGSCESCQ